MGESERLSTPEDVLAEFVETVQRERGIALYPAQEEALLELATGSNVILSTPTGSGKSLVAEGAHALNRVVNPGTRTFYTAPIKALVSEKFFELSHLFGAGAVGMITGDSSVNADAGIICCTAEILANLALREGASASIGAVVMDEFHFYGDPDRGWAWQVPLIELPRAQFLLMSATLGDTTAIARRLEKRTGRRTAEVTSVERPVPLHFDYVRTPIHETIETLLQSGRAPIYVVHFSQADAVERAQALTSIKVVDRAGRDEIARALGDFRFLSGFGTTLSRLVRAGIGVHHAGMLPRYRRLVEQLAQEGLLRVICGTDTLGVGINVPIRTVLITALSKFDGTRMRHLNAREFHQIAGRAGRAGFDTEGDVVVEAPEHEIENLKAERKAGDDPKKKRRIVRKSPPPGFVSWSERTFSALVSAQPEPLTSRMTMTNAILLDVIARGGDPLADVERLVFDNDEPPAHQYALARRAIALYRSLRDAGIVVQEPAPVTGRPRISLTVDLPANFALDQPLSPFALAAFELLDRDSDDYALDVISVVEATLEDPSAILAAQRNMARRDAVAQMKADGIEYEERMERLEEITYSRPLADLLDEAFLMYVKDVPWAADFELHPKSVVRDMVERAFDFRGIVSFYGLARSEGVVLRYLSDAFRALTRTVPDAVRTDELDGLIAWLGAIVRGTDSSLVDEWSQLVAGEGAGDASSATSSAPPTASATPTIVDDARAFTIMVRNALFQRVQLVAWRRWDDLGRLDAEHGWNARRWEAAASPYFEEYPSLGIDRAARAASLVSVTPDVADGVWHVRQTFDDPEGDHDWGIDADVDLAASAETGAAALRIVAVGPVGTVAD